MVPSPLLYYGLTHLRSRSCTHAVGPMLERYEVHPMLHSSVELT